MWRARLGGMLVAAGAAVAALSCASGGAVSGRGGVAVDEAASGSTVTLRMGETLTVALRGNPTTGYLWQVARGADGILARQGEPQFKPSGPAVGAGGVFTFLFKAVGRGEGTLRLIYARPFPSAAQGEKSFEIAVSVKE